MDYKLMIKDIRIKKDMTQTELARKSGLRQAYISQLESDDPDAKSPTLRTLFHIAAALDVCPHVLVQYKNECVHNCSSYCKYFFNDDDVMTP